MSRSRALVLLLASALAAYPAFAESPEADAPDASVDRKNSIGFDLFAVSYDQYSVSYERLLIPHLSASVALGFSPLAAFNAFGTESGFTSYLLVQAEARSYVLGDNLKDLYIGFGYSLAFAPNLLEYKDLAIGFDSSVALNSYGEIGWRFLLAGKGGFYIDPNLFWLTTTPLPLSIAASAKKAKWGYRLSQPLIAISIGHEF
jgi:hypothetical protein